MESSVGLSAKESRTKTEAPRPTRSRKSAGGHAVDSLKPGSTSPKPERRSRRGDDVRKRVISAALESFATYGFEGTSTRGIATSAGVTHTLVIYHFHSKEELWVAAMEAALETYTTEIRVNLETSAQGPAKEGLARFIEQFIRMSARYPQVHCILTNEANQGTQRLEWVIDKYLRWHFNTVRDLIRRGQGEGTVRECDPARLYYLIVGAGGTPYSIRFEYEALTGRNVFSETEILRNIALIYDIVFTE
jgi:TetR/AcrR family transcriptional regulator